MKVTTRLQHKHAALNIVNPATATLPTMSRQIEMLRPDDKTKSHCHTSTSVYHAFLGNSTIVINGQPAK